MLTKNADFKRPVTGKIVPVYTRIFNLSQIWRVKTKCASNFWTDFSINEFSIKLYDNRDDLISTLSCFPFIQVTYHVVLYMVLISRS